MDTAERTLVVILAGALAVLLLLAIIATVKLIKLLTALKRITDRAENLADTAQSFAAGLKKAAAPLAFGKLFSKVAQGIFDKQQSGSKKRKRAKHE